MKPSPDSSNSESSKEVTGNAAHSVEAQRRREAAERSRIEKLLHARADGEISEAQSAELTRLCSDHARFANEVKRTRLALDQLSVLAPSPDFSARVMDRCESHVQFTTRPRRKTLRRNRLVLAGVSALFVIGVVFTHRLWPGWNQFDKRSEQRASARSAGQKDVASSLRTQSTSGKLPATDVETRLAKVPETPKGRETPRVAARDTKLKLGDTSRFDAAVTRKVDPIVVMASQANGAGVPRNSGTDGLIFANDQWLLGSFLSPQGRHPGTPPMASMVMSGHFMTSSPVQTHTRWWGLPAESEQFHNFESRDSLWPYWPTHLPMAD